jgi:hypothetical protein
MDCEHCKWRNTPECCKNKKANEDCELRKNEKSQIPLCQTGRYTFRISFPHTSLGPVYKEIERYVNTYCFKMRTNIMGTFDKSLQQIQQARTDVGAESLGAEEPIFMYSPQLQDMVKEVDLPRSFMNEHPLMTSHFQKRMFYEDGTFINYIPNRMVVSCPFKVFTESKIQVDDMFMSFNNVFRNKNKWLWLEDVIQWVLIPNELKMQQHEGELAFDFKKAFMGTAVIPSLNSEWNYLPLTTTPWIKMTSLSDSSNFYGGTGLPEYSLSGNFELEVEIPVGLIINTRFSISGINYVVNPDIEYCDDDDYTDRPVEGELGMIEKEEPTEEDRPEGDVVEMRYCSKYLFWSEDFPEDKKPFLLKDIKFDLHTHPFIVLLNGIEVRRSNYEIFDHNTIQIFEWPDYSSNTQMLYRICSYRMGHCKPPMEWSKYHRM